MSKGPLGSWPEVERRKVPDRRIHPERRSGKDRRTGMEGRSAERRQGTVSFQAGGETHDRRSKTQRRSDLPRRVIVRRSGLDRRLQPLFG